MTWFKNDQNLAFHSKVLMAGNSAMGLWVRAGSWVSAHLTDGFMPGHVALAIGTSAEVEHLVTAGLWEVVDGGYQFHDWLDYNPSAAEVKARRQQTTERQQRWREKAATRQPEQRAIDASVDALPTRLETPIRSDPVRSGPESSNEDSFPASRRKQETPLAENWMPTAAHRVLAEQRGLSLDWQADMFRDHAGAHDRRCANWNLAFSNWLKRADPVRDRGGARTRTGPVIDRSKPWAPDGYPA